MLVRTAVTGLIALLIGSTATRADVVYDNGSPDLEGALFSDFSGPSTIGSHIDGATPGTFTRIQFWGIYFDANTPEVPDDFTVQMFEVVDGIPLTSPVSEHSVGTARRTHAGAQIQGYDVYAYVADLPPVTYSENGADRMIAVINDTADDPDDYWGWATSAVGTGSTWVRFTGDPDWHPSGGVELAYRLRDDFCGDGTVDQDVESCDDGDANGTTASCCTATCELRPDASACQDGDPCTSGDSCSAGACSPGGPTLLDPTADLDQTIACVLEFVAP